MIACICHNLSYKIIDDEIKNNKTFKELIAKKCFGTQCKKCLPDIKKYIKNETINKK